MEGQGGPCDTIEDHGWPWIIIEVFLTPRGLWRAKKHHWGLLRAMKYHWGPWNAVEGHGTQLRAIEQHWGPWRTLHYSWGLSNIGEVYWFLKFSSSLLVYSRLHVSWFCNFSTTFMLFSSSSSIREILVVKSIQEIPTFRNFWFQRVIMKCVDCEFRGLSLV